MVDEMSLEFSIEYLEVLEGAVPLEGLCCPKMFMYDDPGPEAKLDPMQREIRAKSRNNSLLDMEDITLVAEQPSTIVPDTSPARERASSFTAPHDTAEADGIKRLSINTNAEPARKRQASNTKVSETKLFKDAGTRTSDQADSQRDSGQDNVDLVIGTRKDGLLGVFANTRASKKGVRQRFAWLSRSEP